MNSVSEVLSKAADLLEQPGSWTQGAFSRNADGSADRDENETAATNPVCWCALGALAQVQGIDVLEPFAFSTLMPKVPAHLVLQDVVGCSVEDWNDAPSRTQAEVVAKLREASALARDPGSAE